MKTVIMDIMKRSFTELSKESQIILGIIITIITIWEISAFLNMIERKRRWYLLSPVSYTHLRYWEPETWIWSADFWAILMESAAR